MVRYLHGRLTLAVAKNWSSVTIPFLSKCLLIRDYKQHACIYEDITVCCFHA